MFVIVLCVVCIRFDVLFVCSLAGARPVLYLSSISALTFVRGLDLLPLHTACFLATLNNMAIPPETSSPCTILHHPFQPRTSAVRSDHFLHRTVTKVQQGGASFHRLHISRSSDSRCQCVASRFVKRSAELVYRKSEIIMV
ncbi:hypothetical protein EDC01DRAFT_263739 [Geopyxis carbonaria]|nr:hypothetical protein EDC01DRAFT_263739 [Geopyxis carbonaria]